MTASQHGSKQHWPKLGASACIWRDGKVLLAQRAKPPAGMWAFPGGHVEAGEKTSDAAARELMEETGMTARFSELLGLYDVIRRDAAGLVTVHYVIACYLGEAGPGEPRAASDAMDAQFFDPERLSGLALAPNIAAAIARARELRRG
jgi:8-oxo-dGTP diphosphatase